ncbi:MAG: hypothetical protein AB4080_15695 [Trichodesmium sp.]
MGGVGREGSLNVGWVEGRNPTLFISEKLPIKNNYDFHKTNN